MFVLPEGNVDNISGLDEMFQMNVPLIGELLDGYLGRLQSEPDCCTTTTHTLLIAFDSLFKITSIFMYLSVDIVAS